MSGPVPREPGAEGGVPAYPLIRLAGVRKSFGDKVVLDRLDLEIDRGESVAVIGASGAGKSVLLKCIVGLLRPDAGTVTIVGTEAARLAGARRDTATPGFGVLFQGGALFDSMPVWENVAFSLIHNHRVPRRRARDIAVRKLARVGLGRAFAERFPASLSVGMRKRVALARAIAADPELLFFDEPTTGLDPIMGEVINALIVECVRALGAAALIITHDMSSACKIADRIAMIDRGRIVWSGGPKTVFASGDPVVDRFVRGRSGAAPRPTG